MSRKTLLAAALANGRTLGKGRDLQELIAQGTLTIPVRAERTGTQN